MLATGLVSRRGRAAAPHVACGASCRRVVAHGQSGWVALERFIFVSIYFAKAKIGLGNLVS